MRFVDYANNSDPALKAIFEARLTPALR
jgi:hypothetical protein